MKKINFDQLKIVMLLNETNSKLLSFIGIGILIYILASLVEFLLLIFLFAFLLNIWIAIILSFVARLILIVCNYDLSFNIFVFYFRKYPEILKCVEKEK